MTLNKMNVVFISRGATTDTIPTTTSVATTAITGTNAVLW